MESINFFKGYGKVNPNLEVEDQTLHRPRWTGRSRLTTTLTVSLILLLTVILGLMLGALIHESNTELPDEASSLSSSSNSAESIKSVCSVTQYPVSCFTSISSLNVSTKADPETIFKLSLQVSIKELRNISSSLKSINDVYSQAAVNDCASQFEDALSSLRDSAALMETAPGEELLNVDKVKNIQTWISAAMTDEETCLDGLQETGSFVFDQVKSNMERSKEFLSNSLAIIAKMQDLLTKFEMKMH